MTGLVTLPPFPKMFFKILGFETLALLMEGRKTITVDLVVSVNGKTIDSWPP